MGGLRGGREGQLREGKGEGECPFLVVGRDGEGRVEMRSRGQES